MFLTQLEPETLSTGVKQLATHLHQVRRLGMAKAVPSFLHKPSCCAQELELLIVDFAVHLRSGLR